MAALALAPRAVRAQAELDVYASVAPGEAVPSVDVFYDQLSPYGMWVQDPEIGYVFMPEEASFVPYTTGHWEYTDVGFVWVSNDPFGWATSHYGRWAYSRSYGRWAWLPDTEWGPAWVEWRQAGDDYGWAPLAPEVVLSYGYSAPIESWHYCNVGHVLDVNVRNYYVPRARVEVIHRQARPLDHFATVGSVRVAVGPPAATLREHHVEVRPVKLDAKVAGRFTPAEAHTAVQRAQERKPAMEAENKKRIEANPKVREVARKVETQPGARPEGKQPEVKQPARPEVKQPEAKQPARPEVKQPEAKQPAHPEAKQPEAKQPARPEAKQPARPEVKQPEAKQPEAKQPARPEAKQPARPEVKQPEREMPKQPERPQPRPEVKQPEPKPQPAQPPRPEVKQPEPRPQPAQPPPRPEVQRQEPKPQPAQPPRPEVKQPEPRPQPAQPPPRPEVQRQEPKPQPAPHEQPRPQAPPPASHEAKPEKRDDKRG